MVVPLLTLFVEEALPAPGVSTDVEVLILVVSPVAISVLG